jgi:hypothetical protein
MPERTPTLCRRPPTGLPARSSLRLLLMGLSFAFTFQAIPARPATLLHSNDVIVFVGGEDIVAMQEYGYVELLLAQPTLNRKLRFRNLGWEGDTVFEQKRGLNFPTWEQTLEKLGATVVIAQFGQAESLHGSAGLHDFSQAAERLLNRFAATNRRLVVLGPTRLDPLAFSVSAVDLRAADLRAYADVLRASAKKHQWPYLDPITTDLAGTRYTRDGLHLNSSGHFAVAKVIARALGFPPSSESLLPPDSAGRIPVAAAERLRQTIIAKNRLWFDYWRPQNWAFLAGDRTEQPSSRDHRNPKVRWFPNELEQFKPLIEAREREVAQLAAKLP